MCNYYYDDTIQRTDRETTTKHNIINLYSKKVSMDMGQSPR